MSDHQQFAFASAICKALSIVVITATGMNLIVLAIAFAIDRTPDVSNAEAFYLIHSRVILMFTVFGFIASILFYVAVKKRNQNFLYPYAFFHAVVFLHSFCYLMTYFIQGSDTDLIPRMDETLIGGRQNLHPYFKEAGSTKRFAHNIKLNNGAYIIFSLLMQMCLLGVTAFPILYFAKECHTIRAESRLHSFHENALDTASMVPATGSASHREERKPSADSKGTKGTKGKLKQVTLQGGRPSMEEVDALSSLMMAPSSRSRASLYFPKK